MTRFATLSEVQKSQSIFRVNHVYMKLGLFQLLATSFSFTMALMTPLLMSGNALSSVEAGVVVAVAYFFSAIILPKFAHLLDYGKIALFYIAAILATVLGISGMMASTSSLVLSVIIVITFNLGKGMSKAAVSHVLEGELGSSDRNKASALLLLITNIGLVFAALFAFYLMYRYRKTLLFFDLISDVLLLLVLMIFSFRYFSLTKPAPVKTKSKKQKSLIAKPLVSKRGGIFIACFFMNLALFCYMTALPILFNRLGYDFLKLSAYIIGVNSVTVVITTGMMVRGFIAPTLKQQLLLACILSSCGIALYVAGPSYAVVTVATILWSIGESLAFPGITKLIYNQFGESEKGLAAGVKVSLQRFALVVAPLLGAVLIYLPVWVFVVIFAGAPLCSFFYLSWVKDSTIQ